LRRQLHELNKLRYRVRQAELSARNRAQAHSRAAAGTRTSDRLDSARAIADGWVTPGGPALVIGRAPSEGLLRNGVVRALFALGDFPHPRARIAPTGSNERDAHERFEHRRRQAAMNILRELYAAEEELVGRTVVLTDGKAGTIDHVFLDDVHGLRISIRGHEGRWPISTVKHIES